MDQEMNGVKDAHNRVIELTKRVYFHRGFLAGLVIGGVLVSAIASLIAWLV